MAMTSVMDRLAEAGLSVVMIGTNHIGVSPGHLITEEIEQLIQIEKPLILSILREASLARKERWYVLSAAYHSHHFGCRICIAAGKGYGLRCGVGLALWTNCQA
jgi:hypothetical protein